MKQLFVIAAALFAASSVSASDIGDGGGGGAIISAPSSNASLVQGSDAFPLDSDSPAMDSQQDEMRRMAVKMPISQGDLERAPSDLATMPEADASAPAPVLSAQGSVDEGRDVFHVPAGENSIDAEVREAAARKAVSAGRIARLSSDLGPENEPVSNGGTGDEGIDIPQVSENSQVSASEIASAPPMADSKSDSLSEALDEVEELLDAREVQPLHPTASVH